MYNLISLGLTVLTILVMIPLLILLVQAIAAILPVQGEETVGETTRASAAVIIPAHDEALSIAETVSNVREQMSGCDRIIVVADNCSDDTAAIARNSGAEVVIREDPNNIGKGYALDAGIRHLAQTGPRGVVIILDADCLFGPDALAILTSACKRYQVPIQALNLQIAKVIAVSSEGRNACLIEFAWRIQCSLRKIGYMRLGLPCQLMGTGMAFPWNLLVCQSLATGHITEDIKLSIDLALLGSPARFCPQAVVTSEMPPSMKGCHDQRKRWIHGYLSTARVYIPKLFNAAFRRRDVAIFALACDLVVPPLSILIMCCGVALGASLLWYISTGVVTPFLLSVFDNSVLACFLTIAWFYCGRGLIGWRELMVAPQHLRTVGRIFISYIVGEQSTWTRAERKK
jgi:cellulose synthase/poly-beta-1,6-N-acetylglucosamine synthase-like glycosyltransferase